MTRVTAFLHDVLAEPRFVSEVLALAGAAGLDRGVVEQELQHAALERKLVLVTHPTPDAHLQGMDMTTIASVPDDTADGIQRALAEAERRWSDFLRELLATHRCS